METWKLKIVSDIFIFFLRRQTVLFSNRKADSHMQDSEKLKQTILNGTVKVYAEKGLKFTMDDLARHLGMSKKTIYTVYREKQILFMDMVDYAFDSIKESERKVMEDPDTDTVEKLRRILGVLPDGYRDVDLGQLYILREKYPEIYAKVEERLETGWELTIAIMEQGMKEGVLKQVNIGLFKTIFEAALEKFFAKDVLLKEGISYADALDSVVNIMVDGIVIK